MEMKAVASVVIVVIGSVLLGIGAGSIKDSDAEETARDTQVSASAEAGLDVIRIDNDIYERDRKGPVIFSHRKHALDYKILCWDCHHDYDNEGINVWNPWDETLACSECHDPTEAFDDVMKLQTAYHVNCKNCHKAMARDDKKTGPHRKCLTCHEKQ